MYFVKDGVTRTFHLDMDEVLRLEAEDPSFSIIDVADGMDEKFRFTQLYKIARMLGCEYSKLVHEYGYDITDIVNIFVECIKEEGFPSASPEGA